MTRSPKATRKVQRQPDTHEFILYINHLEEAQIKRLRSHGKAGTAVDRIGRFHSPESCAHFIDGQRFGLVKRQEAELLLYRSDEVDTDAYTLPTVKPAAKWLIFVNTHNEPVLEELEAWND
jgi:hypothetical protein